MKKLLTIAACIASLGLVTSASAADLAARPYTKAPPVVAAVYDWSGFYIGANGGWGSSHKCWDFLVAPLAFAEGCHDATGGTVGGQIGYRWQAGTWVFGLEAQGNWADFKGSNDSIFLPVFNDRSRINAFGLFTGQVGYAFNNALFYVKGGAAVTNDRFDVFTSAVGVPTNTLVASTGDQTRWGGVAGVGLEYGFAPNWSAAIEYDHMFMQDKDVRFVTAGPLFAPGVFFGDKRIAQDVDLVTVRINYRWGGAVVARY